MAAILEPAVDESVVTDLSATATPTALLKSQDAVLVDLRLAEQSATVVPENLLEMFDRKDRLATAVWGPQYLEDPNTFQWQPETFMYNDVATGHEVWRISTAPLADSIYHNDIGVSPWSADGQRMAVSAQRSTQAGYDGRLWMTVDTDGTTLRPTVEGATQFYNSVNAYFHWSPQVPDVYYEVGFGNGHGRNELYETVVTDMGVSPELILTYPENIKIDKMISADGKKLLISSYDEAMVYPTTIFGSPQIDDPDGYSIDRDLGLYGTTPDSYSTAHDRYYFGDGTWYLVMPTGGTHRAWWMLKTQGSAADGGPLYDNSDFPVTDPNYDFGEAIPVNADGGSNPDPYGSDYWSHLIVDRWGRYALYSNSGSAYSDPLGPGPGVWDIQNHEDVVLTFGGGAQYHDWHGFTDWTVTAGGLDGYVNQVIYAQKFNDVNSQFTVNSTYTRYDGGTNYESLVRPGQSPDGTKVAWHSEFLNAADAVDAFWSVVYYPHPPTNLEASSPVGGQVALEFLPAKYTDRGWIDPATGLVDEVNGEALYARETKQYQVWRSSSPTEGWNTVGTLAAEYGNDPVTNTLKPRSSGDWVSETNKIVFHDAPGDGVWYYAVTSQEHSGLESDELSEVIQVTVSGGRVAATQIVQGQGQRDFWNVAPPAPSNFSATAESVAGHYRLNWTHPNDDRLRYFNVYYATTGNPVADQSQRIASLAVGTTTYLDWLADPNTAGFYGITSVDRYGNESPITYASTDVNTPPVAVDDAYSIDAGQTLAATASATAGEALTLVSSGSAWTYLDNGSNQGTAWRQPNFDDSNWSQGPAQLGYGDGDEATVVGFGPDAANKFVTTYFRREFQVADASKITDLALSLVRDDGAAVYLNGVEVARDNLAPGAGFDGLATGYGQDSQFFDFAIDPAVLVDGRNVLAVEVHQASATSSDVSFDLKLAGTATVDPGYSGVLVNDSDADGDTLTATLVAGPADGSLALNSDGTFLYTPDAGFSGTDTFSYRANDAASASNAATVTVTVNSTNTPPVAVDDAYSIDEGQTLSVTGAAATEEPVTLVSSGSVWKYLDDGSNQGTVWRASDFSDSTWSQGPAQLGYGDGDEATVVGFGPDAANKFVTTYFRREFQVADASKITDLALSLVRDDGAAVYLNGVEVVRDNLAPGAGFDDLATGYGQDSQFFDFAIDPAVLVDGRNVLAVEVHQASATSSDVSFDLKLAGTATVDPGYSGVLVNDSDADGDTLTATLAAGPASGSLTFNSDGTFLYAPDAGFSGTDTFSYRANDAASSSDPATVTVTVNAINIPPVAVDDAYSIDEGQTLLVTGAPATEEPVTLVSSGSVWKYLDDGSNQGTVWRASDFSDSTWSEGPSQLGYGDGDEATVVGFGPDARNKFITTYFRHEFQVADASQVTDLALSLVRDDGAAVYLNGVEVVRDNLAPGARFDDLATGFGRDSQFFDFAVDPAVLVDGRNVLAVEIHQASTRSSDISFDLKLTGMAVVDPGYSGVLANDSDADGDALTATLVVGPASGSLTFNSDGTFLYAPDAGFSGTDTFSYRADDWASSSTPATVTLTVNSTNTPPVAVDDAYFVGAGRVLVVTGLPATEEPSTLVSAGSAWRYLDDGSNQGTAWREPDFSDSTWSRGPAQLGYGDRDEATVVSFGPDARNKFITTYFRHEFQVADASQVTELALSLVRDDGAAVYLNGVEVVRDNLAPGARFDDLATGYGRDSQFFDFAVDPAVLVDGRNVLAVEMHQASTRSSDISFDLELTGMVTVDPGYSGVLANDSDADGDTFTATLVVGPASGSLTFNSDGTFLYAPDAGFSGTDTFSYRANDLASSSTPATVTVTVYDTNTSSISTMQVYAVESGDGTDAPVEAAATTSFADTAILPDGAGASSALLLKQPETTRLGQQSGGEESVEVAQRAAAHDLVLARAFRSEGRPFRTRLPEDLWSRDHSSSNARDPLSLEPNWSEVAVDKLLAIWP